MPEKCVPTSNPSGFSIGRLFIVMVCLAPFTIVFPSLDAREERTSAFTTLTLPSAREKLLVDLDQLVWCPVPMQPPVIYYVVPQENLAPSSRSRSSQSSERERLSQSELDEIIRLAERAIEGGDDEGRLVKGLALARKGRWSEGIIEYAGGLRKFCPKPEHGQGLRQLMEKHPAVKGAPKAQGEDEEEPAIRPEVDEAIQLAEQAIAAGNAEGHLAKGEALAEQGRFTDAIREYGEGLYKLCRSAEYRRGLRFLIENHPGFTIPDAIRPPIPQLADKRYVAGLRYFFARQYKEAEQEFFDAVRYSDQDARYLYFLGLSRLEQGKQTGAFEAFRRGGRLEEQAKPSSAMVSIVLERIQGPDRQTLNRYRPR